jgi:hypothetical protein
MSPVTLGSDARRQEVVAEGEGVQTHIMASSAYMTAQISERGSPVERRSSRRSRGVVMVQSMYPGGKR